MLSVQLFLINSRVVLVRQYCIGITFWQIYYNLTKCPYNCGSKTGAHNIAVIVLQYFMLPTEPPTYHIRLQNSFNILHGWQCLYVQVTVLDQNNTCFFVVVGEFVFLLLLATSTFGILQHPYQSISFRLFEILTAAGHPFLFISYDLMVIFSCNFSTQELYNPRLVLGGFYPYHTHTKSALGQLANFFLHTVVHLTHV